MTETETKTWNTKKPDNDSDSELPELEFVNYREIRKDEGKFTHDFDTVRYRGDAGPTEKGICITLIDSHTAQAVTVWATQHPDALFEVENPDGVRLMNAITREWSITDPLEGTEIATLVTNDGGGSLLVAKVRLENGYDAWRWTVKKS